MKHWLPRPFMSLCLWLVCRITSYNVCYTKLLRWNAYDLADGVPLIFRNTFLVAADIENESIHRGEKGELICDASRNVVVYYASDDLALRASKAANLKNKIASRRLGHSGPENMALTPSNVYIVDCDDINNEYDLKGHSYFRSGPTPGQPGVVFDHIFECMQKGRVFPEDPRITSYNVCYTKLLRLDFEAPHLQIAGTSSNALRQGHYPEGADEFWAEHLAAVIIGWREAPNAPPAPDVPHRPAISSIA